jgi:hypothetical protein
MLPHDDPTMIQLCGHPPCASDAPEIVSRRPGWGVLKLMTGRGDPFCASLAPRQILLDLFPLLLGLGLLLHPPLLLLRPAVLQAVLLLAICFLQR